MTDNELYSIGIDLGQTPSPAALARGDHDVEILAATADAASLVESLIARDGITPTAVVIASPSDQRTVIGSLAGDVVRRCGLAIDSVWVADRFAVEPIGLAYLRTHNNHGADTDRGILDEPAAAAIGAALSGIASDDHRRAVGWLAAGTGAAIVGGLGAVLATDSAAALPAALGPAALGPAGVPLTQVPAAGTQGVPFAAHSAAGPAGVPFGQGGVAGPSGVTMGSGAAVGPAGVPINPGSGAGPSGVPLGAVAKPARRARTAVIVGAAAAAIAVGIGVAASSGGDPPAASVTSDRTATSVAPSVLTTTDTATVTVVVDASTATTATPATAATPAISPSTEPVEGVGAGCTVGSWLADNQSFGESFTSFAAAAGGPIVLDAISGAIRVDIAANGAVVTTYDDFTVTATVEGLTSEVFVTGVDTNQIDFADDSSYTVTSTEIASTQRISAEGIVFLEEPSPEAAFFGSSTYTCAGDRLDVTIPGPLGDWVAIFTRNV